MDKLGTEAVALTRELVAERTVNPPGDEERCAGVLGRLLEDAGFRVARRELAPGRPNLVATLPGTGNRPPLAMTGHLDTVPLGGAPWSRDPFAGETEGGRLYGRGSSDMKAGVAAMVVAARRLAALPRGEGGLTLVLTAGEETGCEGAALLARDGGLGAAGALVVGEPTANRPFLGHRGLVWLEGRFAGVTAHASMPHLGDNAAVKAAAAAVKLHGHGLGGASHPALGRPTLNVGRIAGGANLNSVPDAATLGVDVRIVPGQSGAGVRAEFERLLGAGGADAGTWRTLVEVPPVWTAPEDAWVGEVFERVAAATGERTEPAPIDFVTDASFLTPGFGGGPTVILGPGEPDQAHRTDEYARIDRIEAAAELYLDLARRWCGL